jgi:hypothetical protein
MKKSKFSAVQQLFEVIALIDEKFPSLSEDKQAEILKSCFKVSASV